MKVSLVFLVFFLVSIGWYEEGVGMEQPQSIVSPEEEGSQSDAAESEEQWRQERIEVHQGIAEEWMTSLLPTRRALEEGIETMEGLIQRVKVPYSKLLPDQQNAWDTALSHGARQALGPEFESMRTATEGIPLGSVNNVMQLFSKSRDAINTKLEEFERESLPPFVRYTEDQNVETLSHVPPLPLSQSLREAERLGQDPAEHVLRIQISQPKPTMKDPTIYQSWAQELKNKVSEGQEFEAVSRSKARTNADGRDAKGENRNQIIELLTQSGVAKKISWMAYDKPDFRELSYAQKGALIKGYLAATGRNPHDPTGETWDEAQYAAMQTGVPGLLPFQEIIGRMRMCQREEEEARSAGAWDDDFDC